MGCLIQGSCSCTKSRIIILRSDWKFVFDPSVEISLKTHKRHRRLLWEMIQQTRKVWWRVKSDDCNAAALKQNVLHSSGKATNRNALWLKAPAPCWRPSLSGKTAGSNEPLLSSVCFGSVHFPAHCKVECVAGVNRKSSASRHLQDTFSAWKQSQNSK